MLFSALSVNIRWWLGREDLRIKTLQERRDLILKRAEELRNTGLIGCKLILKGEASSDPNESGIVSLFFHIDSGKTSETPLLMHLVKSFGLQKVSNDGIITDSKFHFDRDSKEIPKRFPQLSLATDLLHFRRV